MRERSTLDAQSIRGFCLGERVSHDRLGLLVVDGVNRDNYVKMLHAVLRVLHNPAREGYAMSPHVPGIGFSTVRLELPELDDPSSERYIAVFSDNAFLTGVEVWYDIVSLWVDGVRFWGFRVLDVTERVRAD